MIHRLERSIHFRKQIDPVVAADVERQQSSQFVKLPIARDSGVPAGVQRSLKCRHLEQQGMPV